MARMLVLDGDECLWNIVCEVLESEGYDVGKACNDYEGLPHPSIELRVLTLHTIQYFVVFWRESPPAGSAYGLIAFPHITVVPLRQRRLARHAPVAAAESVGQALYALLLKPLHPLVDKATADPDRGGNGSDRYAIGNE
jgi:hypothetical protein